MQESFTYFKIFKPISWGKDPLNAAAVLFRGSLAEIYYRRLSRPLVTFGRSGRKGSRMATAI